MTAPIKQIAGNAGLDGSIVCQKVLDEDGVNFGFNALTGKYGDMLDMGVIVPCKVERVALQNAGSIASLLLTTDAIVSEIKGREEGSCSPRRRNALLKQSLIRPINGWITNKSVRPANR